MGQPRLLGYIFRYFTLRGPPEKKGIYKWHNVNYFCDVIVIAPNDRTANPADVTDKQKL